MRGILALMLILSTSASSQVWEDIAGPIWPMRALVMVDDECVVLGTDSTIVFDRYGALRDVARHPMGNVNKVCVLRDTVWAGGDLGLWYSVDACRSWERTGASANVIFVESTHGELLYTVQSAELRVISGSAVWTLPSLRYDLVDARKISLPDGRLSIRTDTGIVLVAQNSTDLIEATGRLADMEGIEEWGEQFVGWIDDTLFISQDLEEWSVLRTMPRVGTRMSAHINNDMLIADSSRFYRVSLRQLNQAIDTISTLSASPVGITAHNGVMAIKDKWQIATIDEEAFERSTFGAMPGGDSHQNGAWAGNHWLRSGDTILRFGKTNWRTVNRGRSWLPLAQIPVAGQVYNASCVLQRDSVIMIVDHDLMRSSDVGATWSAIDVGEKVWAIANDNERIVAITRSKALVSRDTGLTFEPWIEELSFDPGGYPGHASLSVRGDTVVFFGGVGEHGRMTTNAGKEWVTLQSTYMGQATLWNGWCIVTAMDNSYATPDAGRTFMRIEDAPEPVRSWMSHQVTVLDDGSMMRTTFLAAEGWTFGVERFSLQNNAWESVGALPSVPPFYPYSTLAFTEKGDVIAWVDSTSSWYTYLLDLHGSIVSAPPEQTSASQAARQRTVYATSPVRIRYSDGMANTLRCFDVMGREVPSTVVRDGEDAVVDVAGGGGPFLVTFELRRLQNFR
jgi:hypothetical protein